MRIRMLAVAGVVVVATSAAACSSSSSGGSAGTGAPSSTPAHASGPAGSGAVLKTATIGGVTVVTNARGFTLYSFAPDTATTSKCSGACAQIWPPATGPATAGQGVTGRLSTITRSDGATQATYDGRPLYTYVGDKSPGQATGNGLNAAGGIWHEIAISGTTGPASNAPPGGSGGYGY